MADEQAYIAQKALLENPSMQTTQNRNCWRKQGTQGNGMSRG
jgi:hypothetical protein